MEEPVPDDLDATLRGTEVDDKVAGEPGPSPRSPEQPSSPGAVPEVMQSEGRRRKRGSTKALPIVRSISPRRTRAGSNLRSINLHDAAPAVSRTTSREKAKTKTSVTVAATVPQPDPESQVVDEFIAYSDDEGDMHEVEADLQPGAVSPGALRVTSGYFISP